MITIDAGNEYVAVICLFLMCFGAAALAVLTLALYIQARAHERERRRTAMLERIGLSEVIE